MNIHERITKILNIINFLVFLFATATVISIFYQGLTLKWYTFVPVLFISTDILFIVATILHLIFNRRVKNLLYFNIFSSLLIAIAVVLKILNIEYFHWGFTLWNFYILYFYGIQVLLCIFRKINLKKA